jgi:hypothetical protein
MSRTTFKHVSRISVAILLAFSFLSNSGCSPSDNTVEPQQQHQSQQPSISQQGIDLMKADWSKLPQHLQDAIAAQEENTTSLMSINGVIGTGVGQSANGKGEIVVFTERADVHGIPAEVSGHKTRVENIGKVEAMGKGFTGKYRPVPCGVSIGNKDDCAAGTLGCVVRNGAGTRYMLSNLHVLEGSNGGSNICQPGRYDDRCRTTTEVVASNVQLIPILYGNSLVNYVDCGIASYGAGMVYSASMVNNIYTPSETLQDAAVGLAVKKVGRTSGLTNGTIGAINVTISVSYGTNKVALFKNQIHVSGRFIQSGDSGSLMVASATNRPVGLCFAGSNTASFANPIGLVLSALNVQVSSN